MNENLYAQWNGLMRACDIDGERGRALCEDLVARYAEPGRAYHTLDHVAAMLETVDQLCLTTRRHHPTAIRLSGLRPGERP